MQTAAEFWVKKAKITDLFKATWNKTRVSCPLEGTQMGAESRTDAPNSARAGIFTHKLNLLELIPRGWNEPN